MAARTEIPSGGFLGDLALPDIAQYGLVALIIGLVVGLLGATLITWASSRIVVPYEVTFGNAGTVVGASILISIVGAFGRIFVPQFANAAPGTLRATLIVVGISCLALALNIIVPMKTYRIDAFRAIALHLVSLMMSAALLAVTVLGFSLAIGFDNVKARIAEAYSQAQQSQASGGFPVLSFVNPMASGAPAAPVDHTGEIDLMLNSALHPMGGHPTLSEREDMVRLLQVKLQAQKSALPAGDAHATLVFQNELNRYKELLKQVVAERKLHPFQEGVAGRDPMPGAGAQAH